MKGYTMQLTKKTIDVLKNFAGINQGILIKEGDVIKTTSQLKHIVAIAKVDNEFTKEFAIYNLPEFLSTLSMFNNPDIKFNDKYMEMNKDAAKAKYYYSPANVIVTPPNKEFKAPPPDLTFHLSKDAFASILKASGIMRLEEVKIDKNGITIFNSNSTGNQYEIELPVDEITEGASAIVKVENLKMIETDYNVSVSTKGVASFVSVDSDLEYHVQIQVA